MTKSLTEQLKNRTLKDGVYYIKDKYNILIGLRYSLTMTRLIDDECPSFEVLAPVPSYDEYKKLKERLDNAHRTLCEVLRMSLSDEKDISKIYDIINPTLEKLNQPLI